MTSISSNPKSPINPVGNQFPEESEDINLSEVLRVLSCHQVLIIVFVLGCLLVAAFYAFFWPKTYEAVTSLKVTGTLQTIDSKTVVEDTIQSLDLMNKPEFKGLSKQGLIEKLSKNTQVKDEAGALTVRVRDHNPQFAADLANAWAPNLIRVNLEMSREAANTKYKSIHDQLKKMKLKLEEGKQIRTNNQDPTNDTESNRFRYKTLLQQDQEARMATDSEDPGIEVVDAAVVPERAIEPKKSRGLIFGLLFGLLVGVISAFSLEKIQDRVRTGEDLQKLSGLASLAVIPDFYQGRGKDIFSPTEKLSPKYLTDDPRFERSPYRESLSLLSVNLTALRADKKPQAISVFSSNSAEGKTLINANLALTLSQMGKKVLLIDANLRQPSVGHLFGISLSAETGLSLVLSGKRKIESGVVKSQFENLSLLPSNIISSNPSVLLGSETFKQLIQELKKHYDYIVIDGAPILPVADSVVLSAVLDGVILMARCDQTRKDEFRQALQRLSAANAPLLGTVLNGVEIKKSQYAYGNTPIKA